MYVYVWMYGCVHVCMCVCAYVFKKPTHILLKNTQAAVALG